MFAKLTVGPIIKTNDLWDRLKASRGSLRQIDIANHGAAILVVHQMEDDANENQPSPKCEAYTEMLVLQDRLAKLVYSYNPELSMAPGMAAQFNEIRDQLDRIYRIIEE